MVSKEIKRKDATAEGNIGDGEITEYDQPEASPYAKTIILSFREEKQEYPVPWQFIEKLPSLAAFLEPDITHIALILVEEDMAHTIVHYLYTGNYQTLHDSSSKGIAKWQKEYKRSVLAYCVGLCYDMTGLSNQAMRYMKTFDDSVNIQDILALAKEVFRTYGNFLLESQYPDYIRGKLESTIEANEGFFKQSQFLQGFGGQSIFDKLMVKSMASVYSNKISVLSNENKALKAVNESLCKDKDKPTCPKKLGPTWAQATSKSVIPESGVLPPKPAPLLEEDCSGESSSDGESLDGELGFVNVGKNREIQERQPSHVEASA